MLGQKIKNILRLFGNEKLVCAVVNTLYIGIILFFIKFYASEPFSVFSAKPIEINEIRS